ncbi:fibronectin type III domain-containing protein [Sedimentitalea sp. HM32M-2]|uniref:fibronectin type III domain-containing protein n=1 Tax=Sedimentitalea sp. HM32M-2 TaxID=3351566 RepID=UPI0036290446
MSDTFADDQSGAESPGAAPPFFVVSVSGLTANPVYGQTAQIGTPLYASAHDFSETAPASVGWQWRDSNGDLAGATDAAYTPVIGDNLETLHPVATPVGDYAPRSGPAHTVRFAPPVATGVLPDVSYSRNTGDKTVATAGTFTGSDLSYLASTSLAGVTIDSSTGIITIPTAADANGTITVTARNSGGSAQRAFNVSVAMAATAPAAMSAPTVSPAGATSLRVDLAPAPDDGGSPITSYDLRWRESGGNWKTIKNISDPETLSGLTSDVLHQIRTRAVNAIGMGAWSTIGSGTPTALPRIAANAGDTVDLIVGDGTFSVTVSGAAHAHHNGTHGPFASADLDAGPVMVVAPVIAGSAGTGETLTAAPGLWVHDTGSGSTTVVASWQRDTEVISGETGATYATTTTDEGKALEYRETASNAAGTRIAASNDIAIPEAPTSVSFHDTFDGYADGTKLDTLTDYTRESGWASAVVNAGVAEMPESEQNLTYSGTISTDHYAEATLATLSGSWESAAFVFGRYIDKQNHYRVQNVDGGLTLVKIVGGVFVSLGAYNGAPAVNDKIRIECQGTVIRLLVNGVVEITADNEADLSAGKPGFGFQLIGAPTATPSFDDFGCGDL